MNRFKRHPVITISIFVVTLVVFLDFFVANVYKVINGYSWSSVALYSPVKIEKQYRIKSKKYHHDLEKNKYISRAKFGGLTYSVYTNSLGFRDGETRDISLVLDKHRILFIGDSFTEGSGFNYENTFVGLVASELSKKGIEVLNAGVQSYSPIIYWRKIKYLLEEVGLKIDEVVVFLDISDIEDEVVYYYLDANENVLGYKEMEHVAVDYATKVEPYEKFEVRKKFLLDLREFLKNNTILIYCLVHNYRTKVGKVYSINNRRALWTIDKNVYREYGESGLMKAKLYMDKLYELLAKNKTKLVVAVYPWPDQIIYGDLNSIQVSFWENWCREKKVHLLNYFPYFVTGRTINEKKVVLDKYFIESDLHWNKNGNRLIADIFLDYYLKSLNN